MILTFIPCVEDPHRASTFAADEHQVSPAKMRFAPVADDNLSCGVANYLAFVQLAAIRLWVRVNDGVDAPPTASMCQKWRC